MFRKITWLFFICLPLQLLAQPIVSIIPQPVSLLQNDGHFIIDAKTGVNFDKANKDLVAAAEFLTSYIKEISGYALPLHTKKGPSIELIIEKTNIIGDEGYVMKVLPRAIKIIANTKTGLIYGMQSLFQTLPQIRTNGALQVPCMDITDYPRFKWRGMHLDVCRHFFSAEMVKEYINLLATYKFNKFHWHLTDDQGWRLEIKKYPKLTSVGAWRANRHAVAWSESEPTQLGEETTYGGYYTQEQVKNIVAYAQARNITIVPEIEMPGHSEAAISAYPFLSCTQHPQTVITGGIYPPGFQTNYCAGNDSVFLFLENVLAEVIQLFPSDYIHIGGDEVDKSSWKSCPKCQARMKANGLKDVNELQSYFIKRIGKYLLKNNRKFIGWDEILEGGLAPSAAVMSWRGEAGGIAAAKMHHHVVMAPGTPLYFDHYQAGPAGEPTANGGFNSLKMVYDYNPIPEELNAEEAKYIMGAQANLWAEYINTVEQVEYMVLPRMLALSEVIWSPVESKNWNNFYERLQYHFRAFEQKGLNYSHGNYTVSIKPFSKNGKLHVALFSEIPNSTIYYTLDGFAPTLGSKKYEHPIPIESSAVLKTVIAIDEVIMGKKPAQQNFSISKSVGKNVDYLFPPSKSYMADGPNSLTDGVRGTLSIRKYWHGFNGKDMVATIDLGKLTPVKQITIGCLQNYNDWILLPPTVTFEISSDGKIFEKVGTVKNTVPVTEKHATEDYTAKFPIQNARYIRVKAKNFGMLPKEHLGAGNSAWLFADEIVVE